MTSAAGRVSVDVDGRTVRLSSLDRVLWPDTGLTKQYMVDYYVRIAPVMLPHLIGHPVTLHRYPEGVLGSDFYQTRCPPHPDWLPTTTLSFPRTGKSFEVAVLDDLASLLWAVNLSTIEFHPYLGRYDEVHRPTAVVFDLDPGPPAGLRAVCRVALALRRMLDDLGLHSVAKTSGVKGLHVVVPLNSAVGYDDTKEFARAIAQLLADEDPTSVTTRMARGARSGKVFVDWSQNDRGKSTVAAYSLRATLPGPLVSCPLTWDEVADVVREDDATTILFRPDQVLDRAERSGDLFRPAATLQQTLPGPARR
jgi:bifunctional non-homologous end joining protein LigD